MNRFIVAEDVSGVPTAQVPLPLLVHLAKCFPAERIVAAYHHETNHVLVNFPDSDTPTVQTILDDLSAQAASACQGLAAWPGLHTHGREIYDPLAGHDDVPEAWNIDRDSPATRQGNTDRSIQTDPLARHRHQIRHSSTPGILAQLREALEDLTPTQQDRLSRMVFDLNTSLAAERLCFRTLFESAPTGYAATDLEGNIQHANDAMHELLGVGAPHLEGQPLFMFLTPRSQTLALQRIRLLRTGAFEGQSFTDIEARITPSCDDVVCVSIRLIVIHSPDPALSTIRWLIRDVA